MVWDGTVFIVPLPFFDGSRGFHQPGRFELSDLRRGNQENTCTSGCYERRGCLGKSLRSSGRLATLGQRRTVGATVAASGPARGPGSIHRLPQHAFEARGRSDITLVSTVGRALIVIGAGRLSPPRRSADGLTHLGTHECFVGCTLIRAAV